MTWAEQDAYIAELSSSGDPERRQVARQMLVNHLVHTVGLLRKDVHDSTEEPRLPGKVNVNLDLKSARGHAGKPGPVPSDRTTPLEAPTLEVGPLAFNDPISLRGTVLHEFEHVHHTEKAIAAVERWRATEPKLEFAAWLEKQKETGKMSLLDHGVIREQVSSGTQATEALAYMTGFMATFHLRPLDDADRFTRSCTCPRSGPGPGTRSTTRRSRSCSRTARRWTRRIAPRWTPSSRPSRSESFWNPLRKGTAT